MSMPKGHKSENGYATVTGTNGYGYREIAEKMTGDGVKMNHATARNYFLRAMRKIAEPLAQHTERSVDSLAADPGFQDAIATLMREKKLCLVK
tara:strand:+ start:814 stop:1092 length:279 start_codon:yes stop_codon:yes gene_type:complete